MTYNRRHRRHGHLFQNRYKSILCQEDPYLLERVRYIHLNPLRAGRVEDLKALDAYQYGGHSVLVGKEKKGWQEVQGVLGRLGRERVRSQRRYREYVQEGIKEGRRPELVRGSLVRGMDGWQGPRGNTEEAERIKGDERILGDGDFIEEVLRTSEETLERKERLKSKRYDMGRLSEKVSEVLGIKQGRSGGRGSMQMWWRPGAC